MREVSGAVPADATAAQVAERTGGNPLFVRELTRLLVAQGGLPGRGGPCRWCWTASARSCIGGWPGCPPRVPACSRRPPSPGCGSVRSCCAGCCRARRTRPRCWTRQLPRGCSPPARTEVTGSATTCSGRRSTSVWRRASAAGCTLPAAPRSKSRWLRRHAGVHPAEVAAHLVAAADAGTPGAGSGAVAWLRRAAEEATARLAPEDARKHYRRALRLLDAAGDDDGGTRMALLLGLAAAHDRAGDAPAARAAYLHAADLARRRHDAGGLAAAALGLHDLGSPSRLPAPREHGAAGGGGGRPGAGSVARARARCPRAGHPPFLGCSPRGPRGSARRPGGRAGPCRRRADRPGTVPAGAARRAVGCRLGRGTSRGGRGDPRAGRLDRQRRPGRPGPAAPGHRALRAGRAGQSRGPH